MVLTEQPGRVTDALSATTVELPVLELHELQSLSGAERPLAFQGTALLEEAFQDARERVTVATLLTALDAREQGRPTDIHFAVALATEAGRQRIPSAAENHVLGLLIFQTAHAADLRAAWVWYIALDRRVRGVPPFARQMFARCRSLLAAHADVMFGEIEMPEILEGTVRRRQARRREAYFRRLLHLRAIRGLDYHQTANDYSGEMLMRLVVGPLGDDPGLVERLSPERLQQLVTGVFGAAVHPTGPFSLD